MSGASDYVLAGMPVPGWFFRHDAWMFLAVHSAQREHGVRGDLIEVGVYLGKSAVLLGYCRAHGENLYAVDLFETEKPSEEITREHVRFYSGLTRQAFEENFSAYHSEKPITLTGASSERLSEIETSSARLIHIDGSHCYTAVNGDISEAIRLCTPGGVVIFDDITQPHAPGVAAAVWQAVGRAEIYPFAQTATKLYTTVTREMVGPFQVAATRDPRLRAIEEHDVGPSRVIEVVELKQSMGQATRPRWKALVRNIAPPIALHAVRRHRRH
jgi:predicted O-methyltransferase YrrM